MNANLSIGTKLVVSSAVTCLSIGGLLYSQWTSNGQIRTATETIASEKLILGSVSRSEVALQRIESAYLSVDHAASAEAIKVQLARIDDAATTAGRGLDAAIAVAKKPDVLKDIQARLDRLGKGAPDYARSVRADLYGQTVDAAAAAVSRKAITEIQTGAETTVTQAVDIANGFTNEAIQGAMTRIDTATTAALAIGGVAMLISLVSALLLLLNIKRPLGSLVRILERMARGDAVAEIPEARRRDEIGAVGRAVEGIRAKAAEVAATELRAKQDADGRIAAERRHAMQTLADTFEGAVGGIIAQVSTSASDLQATAQTMTATAAETASQSTSVAAAAEEASVNVQTVAAAAEELGVSVQEIGRQVSNSADLAQTAVGDADRTAQLVDELSQTAKSIGDVVNLISNIAAQTNLLALNATIEAARAGEAGRGFAVVAAEVKELANQTAKATDEIAGQIGRIQGSTGQAVTAIGTISARIREINTVSAMIAAAVEQQGAATQEIVRNVSQASTGTSAVTGTIGGVAGAAEETGAAANQVLVSATELSRQSGHLGEEVKRFLATVRAA